MFAGRTEFDATWKMIGRGDGAETSMKRSDLGLGEPVNAALVVIDGVHGLVWSRSGLRAD